MKSLICAGGAIQLRTGAILLHLYHSSSNYFLLHYFISIFRPLWKTLKRRPRKKTEQQALLVHAKDNSLFHFFFAESNHQSVPEEKTVPTKLTRHHGIAAIFMALWPMK